MMYAGPWSRGALVSAPHASSRACLRAAPQSACAEPREPRRRAARRVRAAADSSSGGVTSSGGSGDGSDDELMASVGDWRAFRARLVQAGMSVADPDAPPQPQWPAGAGGGAPREAGPELWAHPLVRPETGCLVIAQPGRFGVRQHYFNQAVIFLFAHGEQGSGGWILNRPTEYTIGQLAGFEELQPELSSCPLYMGGDVGKDCTHVMHGVRDLEGAQEVIDGVFVGGYRHVKAHVREGRSSAMDYRWFARYSGWGAGQLEREVAAGAWFLGSCSKELVLKHCINLQKPLWREVLELMGEEYAQISKRAYGET